MKIPVALIIDNNLLEQWQQESLDLVDDLIEVKLILNCQNTHNKKKLFKHFIYYLINFFSLKNALTSKHKFHNNQKIKKIDFDSKYSGIWQSIPQDVADLISKNEIQLVVKFGMSLLKIDESLKKFDIFSFHHGDPETHRGRPAGFYEIFQNAEKIGTIVQKLSNTLDAGTVYSKGYSKIFHYSYKKTALNFFSNSKFIFKHAILNYISNKTIHQEKIGQNYKLPSNFIAILFVLKIIKRKLKRLIYGTFFEKKWNIAKFSDTSLDLNINKSFDISNAQIPVVNNKYSFYADPFFSTNGSLIRTEALNKLTGLGEIIELDAENLQYSDAILKEGHFSYPFSLIYNENEYLLPETSSQYSQIVLSNSRDIETKIALKGLEKFRLVDATLIQDDEAFFLFAGIAGSSMDCLYLFYSNDLFGPYYEHPYNPIVIDPSCARMGGRFKKLNGNYYRFGQNNTYGYGQSLSVMKIISLSKDVYLEEKVSNFNLESGSGPHTIDNYDNEVIIDFYTENFNFFAGYRRLMAKINKLF